jgi:homoserine kinase
VAACLRDRIAEPARAPLYPGSDSAREAARAAGALGVAVSGAGPTLVAVAPVSAAPAVARALVDAYERAGFRAVAQEAGVDEQGARVTARD